MALNSKLLVLALAIFSFFVPLGFIPLFDLDEGAFSEATREMIASGNYLTTYLNGELRFDKPILIYWLQSFSVSIFGLNEFGLRFPSALAASIWAYVLYLFVKDTQDEQKALYAVIFFVAAVQISIIAKAAIADALLNMFIVLSMFSIYTYIQEKNKKYLYFTFAFIALGVLTKGPVAIMVPFVVTFIYFLIKRDLLFWVKSIFNPIGLLIFLIIAAPWYILEYIDQGQKFIDGFFLKHNVGRFADSMEGHSGSYFYYIPVLLIGLAPFTSYFINIFVRIKQILKDDLQLFMIIWFVFVFMFFSFSNTKLPHYVIYGYTPLFILAVIYFETLKSKFLILIPIVLVLSLFTLLPNLLMAFEDKIKDSYILFIKDDILNILNTNYQLSLLACLICSTIPWLMKTNIITRLSITAFTFLIAFNFVITSTLSKVEQLPIKNAALLSKAQNLNVKMYHINNPTFSVYSESIVKKSTHPISGEVLITKVNKLKELPSYEVLYKENGIYLVRIK